MVSYLYKVPPYINKTDSQQVYLIVDLPLLTLCHNHSVVITMHIHELVTTSPSGKTPPAD